MIFDFTMMRPRILDFAMIPLDLGNFYADQIFCNEAVLGLAQLMIWISPDPDLKAPGTRHLNIPVIYEYIALMT